MMEHIIIVGLVTFILAYMLHQLDGPWDVFVKVRRLVGIIDVPVLDDNGNVADKIREVQDKTSAKLVACFWCLSTWISLITTLLYGLSFGLEWWRLPFVWLAAITVSGFIYEKL